MAQLHIGRITSTKGNEVRFVEDGVRRIIEVPHVPTIVRRGDYICARMNDTGCAIGYVLWFAMVNRQTLVALLIRMGMQAGKAAGEVDQWFNTYPNLIAELSRAAYKWAVYEREPEFCTPADIRRHNLLRLWHSNYNKRIWELLGLKWNGWLCSISYGAYEKLLTNPYAILRLPIGVADNIHDLLELGLPATARRLGEYGRYLLDQVRYGHLSIPLADFQLQFRDLEQHMPLLGEYGMRINDDHVELISVGEQFEHLRQYLMNSVADVHIAGSRTGKTTYAVRKARQMSAHLMVPNKWAKSAMVPKYAGPIYEVTEFTAPVAARTKMLVIDDAHCLTWAQWWWLAEVCPPLKLVVVANNEVFPSLASEHIFTEVSKILRCGMTNPKTAPRCAQKAPIITKIPQQEVGKWVHWCKKTGRPYVFINYDPLPNAPTFNEDDAVQCTGGTYDGHIGRIIDLADDEAQVLYDSGYGETVPLDKLQLADVLRPNQCLGRLWSVVFVPPKLSTFGKSRAIEKVVVLQNFAAN